MAEIDYMDASTVDASYNFTAVNRTCVQIVRIPAGTDYYATSLKVWVKYTTAYNYNFVYVIYATDAGTYGSTMKPTGSALEQTGSSYGGGLTVGYNWYEKEFAGTTVLYGGEEYAVGIKVSSYTTGTLNVGIDGSGGSHAGNLCYSSNGGSTWSTYGEDLPFYLYGTAVTSDGSVKETIASAILKTTTGINDTV